METRNFQRVYVWELPVRIFHWVNVLCVLALTLSGFLIANPPALLSNAEATNLHSFGIVRYIHFIAGYIFFFNMILRVYWSFVGNQFASWRSLMPFDKKRWGNFKHVIKNDILLMNDKKPELKNISIGHNSVAAFSYLILFIIALISVFTGFALYADTATWFLPKMFSWVTPMLGGDFMVRNIHHIAMWGFIIFVIIHVYLVFFHDWLEGRGEVSSMFGGYKFVREERLRKVKEEKEEEKSEV